MKWTKPAFQEISLGGEVTAYANTDIAVRQAAGSDARARPKSDRQKPE